MGQSGNELEWLQCCSWGNVPRSNPFIESVGEASLVSVFMESLFFCDWRWQREHRLNEHLRNLREAAALLEELLAWLASAENTLTTLEAEPLPDDLPVVEGLIKDHQEFMEDMAKRQPEVDRVCKTKQQPARMGVAPKDRKASRAKSSAS